MKKNVVGLLLMALLCCNAYSQDNPLVGRWDLEIEYQGRKVPSWLEVRRSGYTSIIGRFVYSSGSARPVAEIKYDNGKFSFKIPHQWEPERSELEFMGTITESGLKGQMTFANSDTYNWTAVKAPKLKDIAEPNWGEPINLFNGEDLKGWTADREENQWIVKDGILTSPSSGANLISDQKFWDFKVTTEFRYQENGNSGIYLRGRYETQIFDSKEIEIDDLQFGGVYGFLEPNFNAAKAPGEWQKMEITLIGRRITVVANGITVLENQIIPGITGGALNSNESEPGPFMLQGDHQPIEFKSFVVTPRID